MILGATAFTGSCALFEDEGEYETPAGFTDAQTVRVAVAPGAFVRDGARVLSGAAAARKARGEAAAPDAPARLEAEFFGSYAEGVRVNASGHPRAYVDVVPEGAAAAPARVRKDGAVVAFEGAFPGVSAAFGGDATKVEEFLTIPSRDAVPALAYTLRQGPEFGAWVEDGGTYWAVDKQGEALFTLAAPVVEDAGGKSVTGRWKFEKVEGGVRITPEIDWASLQFPVLFDPTFETPLWFLADRPAMPSGRAGAGSAFYPLGHDCSVIFGGVGPGVADDPDGDYRNDVAVYCGGLWQRGNFTTGIPATSPRPSQRAYVAMGYVPTVPTPGIYMFGGYTEAGPNDEFWLLNLSGTTAKSAIWTQIAPPPVKTPTNWPTFRYMPGLGFTGAGLILFGGVDAFGKPLNDTWLYNGTTWTQLACNDTDEDATNNCFKGRFGLTYAQLGTEAAPEIVAFGGVEVTGTAFTPTNTVQRFTGTGWQTVAIDPLPVPTNATGTLASGVDEPPGRYVAWAARTADDNLLIGSGVNPLLNCGGPAEFTDAWIWRRTNGENRWTIVPSSPTLVTPGRRDSASAVFDPVRAEVLLFGGRLNCGSTAAAAMPGSGRAYRNNKGQVGLTVTCLDTGAPGGPNGNSCDTYRLQATVSGIANDTVPTRMRAIFFRRRGTTWQTAPASCGSAAAPLAPNAGPATFQCDLPAFATGAIDTGFTVRLRDTGYAIGGSLCGSALNTPGCIPAGFEAAATCLNESDPLPSGNGAVTTCSK
ncbi:MAG TPA: hypothetical protein VFS43_22425 [Polyangiaceae bacterium]|nr:hypothetical protein [Polyangiaceae bacterium]